MGPEFIYTQPVRICFGAGQFRKLPEILSELGLRRCVAVCDPFLRPLVERMAAENRGSESGPLFCAVFSEVAPNPQLAGAQKVAELVRSHGAEAVVGIGGGSTMDTAKFAAAIAAETAPAERFFRGELPFPKEHIPVITVPTTAGTGSEVTQVSVMSFGKEKKTINNPAFMPKAAVVDPELTYSVPPRTTMNTGLDALAHALEGYWSRNHQPISDLMAVQAVRLVMENLEAAWRDGNNVTARTNMSLAALLGGLSFALPKTAGSHACSYPLSEDYGLPHGEACAFTLDSFVRINADERLEALCRGAGLSGTEALARRIAELKKLAGLRTRLADVGEVNLDKLAHDSAVHPLMKNNPVAMDEASLRRMFENLA